MKKILALLLAMTMLFALCACGSKTEAPAAAPAQEAAAPAEEAAAPAEEAAAPAEAKRTDLKIQFATEPSTLDFHQNQETARTQITQNMFANLVTYDNSGLIGELAESWSYNEDFTEWTFVIKSGAKFSDGSDITLDDIVYSMNRGLEINFIPEYAQVVSCEAISDNEIKFTLNAPNTLFDRTIAGDGFNVLSKAYMESGADLSIEAGITSGPYYLESWTPGSEMVLKANEGYVLGAPAIKEVDCIFIADTNTAVVALESGQVDYITANGSSLTASEVETVQTFDNVQFVPLSSANYVHMALNFNYEPFADKNVRQAMDLCINRDYLCAILGGLGTPAGRLPTYEGIGGYLPGYDVLGGDLEAAKAKLAESAYPDGFSFVFSCTAKYLPVVESVQAQLKEIGIIVDIDQCVDFPTVNQKMIDGSYQASIYGYTSVTGDIGAFAGLYDTDTANNWDRPNEYGPLLAQSVSLVGAERDALLKEAYDIMYDYVPYLGMYFGQGFFACSEDLDFGVNSVTKQLLFGTMSWK